MMNTIYHVYFDMLKRGDKLCIHNGRKVAKIKEGKFWDYSFDSSVDKFFLKYGVFNELV
jgi:hypothetical protein